MADDGWKLQSDCQVAAPSKSAWSPLPIIVLLVIGFCLLVSVVTGNYAVFQAIGAVVKALSLILRFL